MHGRSAFLRCYDPSSTLYRTALSAVLPMTPLSHKAEPLPTYSCSSPLVEPQHIITAVHSPQVPILGDKRLKLGDIGKYITYKSHLLPLLEIKPIDITSNPGNDAHDVSCKFELKNRSKRRKECWRLQEKHLQQEPASTEVICRHISGPGTGKTLPSSTRSRQRVPA